MTATAGDRCPGKAGDEHRPVPGNGFCRLNDPSAPRKTLRAIHSIPVKLRFGPNIHDPGIRRQGVESPWGQRLGSRCYRDELAADDETQQEEQGVCAHTLGSVDEMLVPQASQYEKRLEAIYGKEQEPHDACSEAPGQDTEDEKAQQDRRGHRMGEDASRAPGRRDGRHWRSTG